MKKSGLIFISSSLLILFSFQQIGFAETVVGEIEAITPLKTGGVEITLNRGGENYVFQVRPETEVSKVIPANKIKKGYDIFVAPSQGNKGVKRRGKGFKPFGGMSKRMKKQLGLPDIQGTPDVPNAKDAANLPEVPKAPEIPKIPKFGKAGSGAAAQPTEEEKSLFGRADENKPLARGSREPVMQFVPAVKRKVMDVQSAEDGVRVVVSKKASAATEEVFLSPPDTDVMQLVTPEALQSKMAISAEVSADGKIAVAKKVMIFRRIEVA